MPATDSIDAGCQVRMLHAECVATIKVGLVDDAGFHHAVELEVGEGFEEYPPPGFDVESGLT